MVSETQTDSPSVTGVARARSFRPGGRPRTFDLTSSGNSSPTDAFQSTPPFARSRHQSVPGSARTKTRSPAITGLEFPPPTDVRHLTFFFSLHSRGGVAPGK